MSSTIKINGKTYRGNSIQIKGNRVIIDGKDADTGEEKIININVEGDLGSLNVESAEVITIKGNVNGDAKSMSGDIEIGGDVTGNVKTMSGDVRCGNIGGKVKTMSGDVKHVRAS